MHRHVDDAVAAAPPPTCARSMVRHIWRVHGGTCVVSHLLVVPVLSGVVCAVVVFLKVESQMSPSAFCTASVKFIKPPQGAPIIIEVYDLF